MKEGLSVDQAFSQIKASENQDSANEQLESNDVVNVSDDDTNEPDEVEVEQVETTDTADTEADEPVSESDTELETDDNTDDLFYDVDGEEVSASTIKQWKDGHFMQSDYTRKTQAHAEEVKKFKAEQAEFTTKQQQLEEKLAEFEAVMSEDSLSAEDLADLREYEPEKYIEYTEKKAKREKLVSDSKKLTGGKTSNFEQEYTAFAQAQDGWLVDNKPTEKATADVATMNSYAEANGFTQDDLRGMKSHHFKALLDAAKYNATKTKADVMAKKVRKAPPITRPKQQAKTTLQTQIQAAEKKLKESGSTVDAMALIALKKKLTTN